MVSTSASVLRVEVRVSPSCPTSCRSAGSEVAAGDSEAELITVMLADGCLVELQMKVREDFTNKENAGII